MRLCQFKIIPGLISSSLIMLSFVDSRCFFLLRLAKPTASNIEVMPPACSIPNDVACCNKIEKGEDPLIEDVTRYRKVLGSLLTGYYTVINHEDEIFPSIPVGGVVV